MMGLLKNNEAIKAMQAPLKAASRCRGSNFKMVLSFWCKSTRTGFYDVSCCYRVSQSPLDWDPPTQKHAEVN